VALRARLGTAGKGLCQGLGAPITPATTAARGQRQGGANGGRGADRRHDRISALPGHTGHHIRLLFNALHVWPLSHHGLATIVRCRPRNSRAGLPRDIQLYLAATCHGPKTKNGSCREPLV
jgi:hypothetical protein